MKEKEISLNDRKSLQLEMLNEIDSFCRKNGIKYALSCGTLIGAIRHGGYIPWDDDVDITMLFPDILRFRELFKSDNIEYIDIETDRDYGFHFSRLVSKKTYSKLGLHRGLGVCIDLYPIIECSNDIEKLKELLPKGNKLLKKRLLYMKWYSRIQRFTPFSQLPGYKKAMNDYYSFMINEVQSIGGGYYYQMGGPLIDNSNGFFHNLWPFNPLEELVEVNFEDSKFMIPERYDEFLRVRYGDYMQLPPEDQRRPYHGGSPCFWK